jgi:glucans biosynthesis protein C
VSPRRGGRYRRRRALLTLGFFAPLFVGALIGLASLSNPQLDPATHYVSALGGPEANRPELFNLALALAGASAFGLGAGFFLALGALGGGRAASASTAALFGVAGAGLLVGALFPWPDPRHLAIQAGLLVQLAPLTILWGLRGLTDGQALRRLLLFAFTAEVALALVNSGWMWAETGWVDPRWFRLLVNDANVGWWERGYMLVVVGWVAVAALLLERRLAREVGEQRAVLPG